MEETPAGRFWQHSTHELHATAVGRRLWQRVRAPRHQPQREESHQQAPYEASYDVARGYDTERLIDRP